MKLNAYTIYDVASGVYMRPFFSQADGQAIRGFKDIATDADHEIGKHPEDYKLFRIGAFNDNTGKMTSYGTNTHNDTAQIPGNTSKTNTPCRTKNSQKF